MPWMTGPENVKPLPGNTRPLLCSAIMCGIAGCATASAGQQSEAMVEKMASELRRRGPDGAGFHSWHGTVLGHRRLAILDLSERGRQPMVSEDGNVGVVFNGAIYNFVELREQLRQHAFVFRSESDTEVLLHGYRLWGIDGLVQRATGM